MFDEFIESELNSNGNNWRQVGVKNLANSIAEVFCVGVDTAMIEIKEYRKENK